MMNFAIEVSSIGHPAGFQLAHHAHDQGQLSLVVRGTLAITSEEGWWVAPPGTAIWVPPGVVHGAQYSESSSIMNVRLGGSLIGSLPRSCTSLIVTELLRALALEAIRIGDDSEAPSETAELIARLVVLQIQRPRRGPGLFLPHGRDRRLQQATSLMRAEPGSNITLDELACRIHTSTRTLARLFVNETGMPFTRWRDHLRVISAVDRLARRQSITQTAMELGYRSTSSFTTLFTRLVGMPPRRYMQHLMAEERRAPGA